MSSRVRARLLVLAPMLGCDDARTPLDLDALAEPERVCIEVVHEQLEVGGPIRSFISDGPGSPGGWALFENPDPRLTFDPSVAVVRVPANADEPPTELIEIDPLLVNADDYSLRAGVEPGSAWVFRRTGTVSVRKIVAGLGSVAGNGLITNFSPDYDDSCGVTWSYELLLIEGRPFVLAVPSCSDDAAIGLHLLELDEHTLDFVTTWSLIFDPCAGLDPLTCFNAYPYRIADIDPGQSTQLAGAGRVLFGFTQDRVSTLDVGIFDGTSVSLLDLRLTTSGPEARLLTFPDVILEQNSLLGPIELAQDPYAVQAFLPNYYYPHASLLFRLDTVTDLYLQATSFDSVLFGGTGQLVQLTYESAMVRLDEGRLQAISLLDDQRWPSGPARTMIELPDLLDFESAGQGMFLLHRAEHPEQIIHLACVE